MDVIKRSGEVQRYDPHKITGAMRKAAIDGNLEEGSFMAGQIAALVKKIQPASEIVQEMMQGAERLLSEAGKWVR